MPAWQWWVLAAGLPLVLCASKLNLDLWYDEAYTIQVFVSQSWIGIATDYSAPNNHVFYSLVLRPFYLVSDAELVLRLPSLLFTAGTLALVFRLVHRRAGLPASVLATLSLGLTQMFLVHTMQVRGYGLSMFLAAWLANLTLPDAASSWKRPLGIVLAGAAFLYTLPTNLLFLVPLAGFAIARRTVAERTVRAAIHESAWWAGACLLAGLLYLPILAQVRQAGAGQSPSSIFAAIGLAGDVFWSALRDWLPILPLALIGLVAWAFRAVRRGLDQEAVVPLLALTMLVGPMVLTALLGMQPFVRNYCPLLPFLAMLIGWGLAECGRLIGRRLPAVASPERAALAGMVLLAAVALPSLLTYPARLAEYRRNQFAQGGYYNYYAANYHPAAAMQAIRDALDPREDYLVCFADADHYPLGLYAARAGLPLSRITARERPVRLYLVLPELPDYEAIGAKSGLSSELLRGLPLVEDFGYFRLYRAPEMVSLRIPYPGLFMASGMGSQDE